MLCFIINLSNHSEVVVERGVRHDSESRRWLKESGGILPGISESCQEFKQESHNLSNPQESQSSEFSENFSKTPYFVHVTHHVSNQLKGISESLRIFEGILESLKESRNL